ncbi:MAG: acyltransferase [Parabacteroides sp.]|nr:acyltransferase [Parabacteroides sp.]
MLNIIQKIKEKKWLKAFLIRLITSNTNPKPRLWVRWFVNPFIHKRGKGSVIRSSRSRIDVFPWNRFEIGKQTTIEDFTTINNGAGPVLLGDRVRIGIGSVVIGPVTIKSGSGLGQHVFVSGFNHGYADGEHNSSIQPLVKKEVVIEEDSHIGANSVVVAGVHIGKRCQIGAGSVVTKDIPDYSVAVGNPARVIKYYDHTSKRWIKNN